MIKHLVLTSLYLLIEIGLSQVRIGWRISSGHLSNFESTENTSTMFKKNMAAS